MAYFDKDLYLDTVKQNAPYIHTMAALIMSVVPVADVVEVVRCKYCKHGEIDDTDFPDQYLCNYTGCYWNNGNHFCGYGERKEGAE